MNIEEVKQKRLEEQIQKASEYLTSVGCDYFIETPWGAKLSNKTTTERKRRPSKYAHGVVRDYIKKHMVDPSEPVFIIPVGEFDVPTIASNASAYCNTFLGKGCYKVESFSDGVMVSKKLSFE